jgi:hypothetical protein
MRIGLNFSVVLCALCGEGFRFFALKILHHREHGGHGETCRAL